MSQINSLTPSQIERFTEWRDRWTAIGLCTDPANRPRAENGIASIYRGAGLATPKIVWCGSPLSQAITRAMLMKNKSGTSVGASVGDSVWASVGDSVKDSVRDSVRDSGFGQHDAGWLSFYDYFRFVVGLEKQTDPLVGLLEIAQAAGWFLPHEKICWIAERPRICSRNAVGRLHNETGPAIEYPDGWQIHAWHGVRVPARVIEQSHTLTGEEILGEANAEVRRAMIEKIGLSDFFARIGNPSPRHMDHTGTLYYIPLPNDSEPLAAIHVTDPSTSRRYFLRVPPQITEAKEAVAWTFNMDPKLWNPIAET